MGISTSCRGHVQKAVLGTSVLAPWLLRVNVSSFFSGLEQMAAIEMP